MTWGKGACSSGRYGSTRTEMLHRKGGSTRSASSFGSASAICLASSAAKPGSAISSTVGQPTETASFSCARPFANTPLHITRSWLPLPQPKSRVEKQPRRRQQSRDPGFAPRLAGRKLKLLRNEHARESGETEVISSLPKVPGISLANHPDHLGTRPPARITSSDRQLLR